MTAALQQMSWECPGLHGPGTRQDISRQTFAQVLEKYPKLIIPLFQRRYCWKESQFEKWWNDVHHGKRDHLGHHSSGNVVVKPNDSNQELIIIDGQQRLTTTLILLITLRNRMRNPDVANRYIKNDSDEYRLIPSYLDRPAFYSMIDNNDAQQDTSSNQWKAYKYFEAKNKRLDDEGIEVMFSNALNKMGMMLVIIVNQVNFGQVYLWLQEKSLFGEAALLHNASPGEYLSGGDMVRNLMLAAVANQDLAAQELFYFQYWLKPIEEKVPKSVTEFVYEFVRKFDFNYESKTEIYAKQYLKDKPHAIENILAYARFYSLYEWRLQKLSGDLESSSSHVDETLMLQVTKELLTEMAKELSSSTTDSFNFKKPVKPNK